MGLADLTVVAYNDNIVIAHIMHKLNVLKRSDIAIKGQLQYIFKCLGSSAANAKTAVIENEYIDKHYLEDYSEYYVRCFNKYPRYCSRIHFFSDEISEEGVFSSTDKFPSTTSDLINNDNYIGYIVIRPIPDRFLAKVCLKPPQHLINDDNKSIITIENKSTVLGISISVETVPVQEQDKVVAACATSGVLMGDLVHTAHI